MSATYTIDVDVARSLVRLRLAGFFTAADLGRFVADRNAAHARLTCGPNQHLSLADLRDLDIQSQDMVAGFQRMLADPAQQSRRLAFVIDSALARIQIGRAADNRQVRMFTDMGEAEAWILAHDPEAEAA